MLILMTVATLLSVTTFTGCGGTVGDDARLVAADSLLSVDADSALALVESLSRDSLPREGDRAYRDLLVTQARYKCYITATSDSDINRALGYYRAHSGDQEKLTRAYIYKGAVMEELGHPDSAMLYYKHAEATADEKDYINLGQINIRIASLYRKYYGDEEICFDKYNRALYYFEKTNNKPQQQICLYNMAICISMSTADDMNYIKKAYDLAIELNDSSRIYKCIEFMCRQLSTTDSTRSEAKNVAMVCMNEFKEFVNSDLYLDLAFIYANDNILDSARYFLDLGVKNTSRRNGKNDMRRYWIQSIISRNEDDTVKSGYYLELKNQIADSIDNNKIKNYIQRIENAHNTEKEKIKNSEISSLTFMLYIVLFIFIMVIIVMLIIYFYRTHHAKSIIKELEHAHVNMHEELLQQLDDKDSRIERFVQKMVSFMQISIDTSEKDSPKVMKRRIKESIATVTNEDFWSVLRAYIDKKYNNLISNIAQNPKITEIDLRFIGLSCCGFSYLEIAVALGITPNYVSKKRQMIAKKLGLTTSLQEYLKSITNQTNKPCNQ